MDTSVMMLHVLQICNVHVVQSIILLDYVYNNFINSVLSVLFLRDSIPGLSISVFWGMGEERAGSRLKLCQFCFTLIFFSVI